MGSVGVAGANGDYRKVRWSCGPSGAAFGWRNHYGDLLLEVLTPTTLFAPLPDMPKPETERLAHSDRLVSVEEALPDSDRVVIGHETRLGFLMPVWFADGD